MTKNKKEQRQEEQIERLLINCERYKVKLN